MRRSFRKSLIVGISAAGLAAASALAPAANTAVPFQLNWMAGGPNAGFAAAVAEGYYKDAGLDVTLIQGNGSGNTASWPNPAGGTSTGWLSSSAGRNRPSS